MSLIKSLNSYRSKHIVFQNLFNSSLVSSFVINPCFNFSGFFIMSTLFAPSDWRPVGDAPIRSEKTPGPGALVAFRFKDEIDKSDSLPEFDIKNLLALGFYIVHGLSDIPISLGFGFLYGPQLRKFEVSKTDSPVSAFISKSPFHIGLFIAVDAPLMNFIINTK